MLTLIPSSPLISRINVPKEFSMQVYHDCVTTLVARGHLQVMNSVTAIAFVSHTSN
jgi:hypothetical protein